MRCHYIYDEGIKVLIPGCIGTAAMGITRCTCRPERQKKEPHSSDGLIRELEAENARLNRIIKNLLKKR
ncbi:hypothetical protein A6C57_00095 [Fibrella sp. ES10-3-2-2]|nr:hypothetical protein A6C57_00095 [Fibrella sp. ES10-3-2-2]